MLLVSMLAAGCGPSKAEVQASQGVSAFFAGDTQSAINLLGPLSEEPDRNYVLNNLRLGHAALTAGDLRTAEAAYYRAYETLNAAGVNNPARTAATVLFNESVRIWLGEPYERAIANFELGVVYYLQGDYANARGALENSLFKLRRYADEKDEKSGFEEQESTFAVAHIMLGRCWQRLGREDLASQSFARAAELAPGLGAVTDPAAHADSNVLLIIEWGTGPRKVPKGSGMVWGVSGSPNLPLPNVTVNGQPLAVAQVAMPMIDTHVMAQQRPWQTIDTYRAIREVAGVGMMIGGVIVMDEGFDKDKEETALLGLGLFALGALLQASSSPDVRQWEMVPRTIYVVPLSVPPGRHDITVDLPDEGQFVFGSVKHEFRNVVVEEGRERALFARILPGQSGVTDFAAPPPQDQPQIGPVSPPDSAQVE